jgi:hypothetical protein
LLSGHAHCFELIETLDTGHADSFVPWIVCGGSGYSLRRQRSEGADLSERLDGQGGTIARSTYFAGRQGHGRQLRRPYSALRIDVCQGSPLHLKGTLLIAEKGRAGWTDQTMDVPIPHQGAHPLKGRLPAGEKTRATTASADGLGWGNQIYTAYLPRSELLLAGVSYGIPR